MAMYSSYFMQASRLSRYVRTLWNYIFMGDRIWQGRTNFGCQNWSGGTVFGGGPIFSLQSVILSSLKYVNTNQWPINNRQNLAILCTKQLTVVHQTLFSATTKKNGKKRSGHARLGLSSGYSKYKCCRPVW